MADSPQDAARERQKIEVRSWFLRASLALNIGLLSGLTVHYLANCGQ